MLRFTYRDLQKCAEREVALRKRVYAKHGKDTPQDVAEVEMMEEIAAHFEGLASLGYALPPSGLDLWLSKHPEYKDVVDGSRVSRR